MRRVALFLAVGLLLSACWAQEEEAADEAMMQDLASNTPVEESPKGGNAAVALRVKGDAALQARNYKEAIDLYSQAITADKNNHMSWFKRATAYMLSGATKSAMSDLDKTIALKADFAMAYSHRAKLGQQIGSFDEAKADFLKSVSLGGGAEASAKAQKVDECKSQYAEGKRQAPHNPQAAIDIFNAVVECAPKYAAVRIERANAYLRVGNQENAIGDLTRASKLQADNLEPLRILAQLYYDQGESAKSLEALRTCLASDQDYKGCKDLYKKVKNLEKAMSKGEDNMNKGAYEEAVPKFNQALEIEPSVAVYVLRLHTKICEAWKKAKKYEEALAACTKAIEINGDHMDAVLLRGDVYMDMENYEKAVQEFQNARQKQSNNQNINQKLNDAQHKLKVAQRKDWYKILGVNKDATEKQIKKAYRDLARVWHPDKHPEGPEREAAAIKFRDISEGHEILMDAEKRRKFDNGEDVAAPQQGGFNPFGQGFNPFGGGNQHFTFQWG